MPERPSGSGIPRRRRPAARTASAGAGARYRAGPRRAGAPVSRRGARPQAHRTGCGQPRSARPGAAPQWLARRSHERRHDRLGLRVTHAGAGRGCAGGALVMLSREALSLESLAALSARERRLVLAALALAALMLVFGVLIPLDRSVAHAHDRLASKRADLSWMQSVAPELASSPAQPAATGESLLVIVDRSAREAGLAGSLTSEPAGPRALPLPLPRAPFDRPVAWLGRLD